ncbi:DUF4135 domain-containing protein [Streptomyces halstedii]
MTEFAQDEVRVVPRPTWTYTTLLDESTHPDLMRDAAERQQVLSLLWPASSTRVRRPPSPSARPVNWPAGPS